MTEPLNYRLVRAVRPWLWNVQDMQTPDDIEKLAPFAVAAVLRELRENADEVEMALSWDLYLGSLIDEIEGAS